MTLAVSLKDCWIDFKRTITVSELPERFNFPFYHKPHPLCLEAAAELQDYIQNQAEWQHNFGLDPAMTGLVIGKMFGVMLVQKETGEVGYITAFSGKLANKNTHKRFVPPIFDMLAPDGFFRKGEEVISRINEKIEALEQSAELKLARQRLHDKTALGKADILEVKDRIKVNKARRSLQRADAGFALCATGRAALLEDLRQESVREQGELRFMQRYWKEQVAPEQAALDQLLDEIEVLKEARKTKSADLQEQLFAQYNFRDQNGVLKNVKEIFDHTVFDNPPSGAGECAAPKMLQFAFQHQLKPLAFAEFWWGASPASEIRKHGQFYAACRGKCEPILGHMLQGIDMDPNPMLQYKDLGDELKTIYEDEQIVVLNKPSEMLSVPGKIAQVSVLEVLQQRYPNATGPLLVHRLDMATSGILIAAKSKEAHEYLQAQFIKKTARKSYIAVLDGVLTETAGTVDLPLRVDLDNRPHQVVCYEYGKPAVTKWKKISVTGKHTRVQLFPVTGRTHQLRMHCAHHLGLNLPILGDDLYGTKANRLHLHAQSLSIKHPATRQEMTFTAEPPF
ncbi:MAG: RluA family pseudouridine synthase [Sphingobacteriales bacterium]|nr:MAG: RluA family pseudouridine synthase [Sphingobacteriales bacterium]